jgi:catechol 2,3-dioxygenase-like lactoylglutathione lyase family enzyme
MSETGTKTVIKQVGRVAVPVRDQDEAIRFYTEKLGFSLEADIPAGPNYRWVEVAPPAGGPPLAIVPPAEGGPVGIDTNVILTTDDIDEAHQELGSRGVDVDDEVSRMGGPVPPMFWFRDQDGNKLLIVEDQGEQ